MTGFVFKIQANMDPNHRDRIAFLRLCSGRLARGMKAKLVRTGRPISLSTPQFFFAQDRAIADEAFAGDIVGIPNHGTLRIGDTLTEGEEIAFQGVPSFAPEILRRIKLQDAMKGKKLREALRQMAEEGVVQLFLPYDGSAAIVGVVGALQLDVLVERMRGEYGLPIAYEETRFSLCRWIDDDPELERFARSARLVDGARSRRRARLHGGLHLRPHLSDGPLALDPLPRDQGVSGYGAASGVRLLTSPAGRGRLRAGGEERVSICVGCQACIVAFGIQVRSAPTSVFARTTSLRAMAMIGTLPSLPFALRRRYTVLISALKRVADSAAR